SDPDGVVARVRRLRSRLRSTSGWDRSTGGYHHSESSLDSIERRCSREQVSQNHWRRPRSVPEVQVSGGGSVGADVPQNAQASMGPT
ncbi:MAG TPA: hypothetical protein VFD73_20410, partial [Gemmatimonadales bacterium]|nr:hypothetical protein [Gemmatimonadales bacterium]